MSKFLSEIKAPIGAARNKKRLGRGDASGHGGTSTRGHKGQKARAGGYHKLGFEGGQMPLLRRVPKRGFTNIFRKEYAVLNLRDLADFPSGTVIDKELMKSKLLLKNFKSGVKILSDGELKVPLTIVADKFSQKALEKIQQAGGTAKTVGESK